VCMCVFRSLEVHTHSDSVQTRDTHSPPPPTSTPSRRRASLHSASASSANALSGGTLPRRPALCVWGLRGVSVCSNM
jgi:hypothetical protein